MPATEPTRKDRDPVKIAWYRVPVARAELNALNQRDDWQGTLQVAGHLGLVAMPPASRPGMRLPTCRCLRCC